MADQRHTGNPGNFAEDRERPHAPDSLAGSTALGTSPMTASAPRRPGARAARTAMAAAVRSTIRAISPRIASVRRTPAARAASTDG